MKFLVEKGADTEIKDKHGNTFVYYLCQDQRRDIEEIIKDIERRKQMIKPNRK